MCAAITTSLYKAVQSERFANFAVEKISKNFLSQRNIELDVARVEVSLFPPATNFKKIEIVHKGKDQEVRITSGDARFDFSFINLLSSELVIDKVYMADSEILIIQQEDESAPENHGTTEIDIDKWSQELSGIVQKIQKSLPVNINAVEFNRLNFKSDKNQLRVYESELRIYDNYILGDVWLEALSIPEVGDVQKELATLDSISFSFELSDDYINLTDVNVKRKIDSLLGEGRFEFEGAQVQLEVLYEGGLTWPLKILKKYAKFDQDGSGFVSAKLEAGGRYSDLKYKLNAQVHDVRSNALVADLVSLQARYELGTYYIDNFNVEHDGGYARLTRAVEVFSEVNGPTKETVSVKTENLSTQTSFHFIKDVLGIVKGRLFGDVDLRWLGKGADLEFTVPKKLEVQNFSLGKDLKKPILQNPNLILEKTKITLESGNEIYIDTDLSFGTSSLSIKGRVVDKEVAFVTSNAQIDFFELGEISGVQILGKGEADLKVYGGVNDVIFDIDVKTKESEVLGYQLGNVETSLRYYLEDKILEIESIQGAHFDSRYNGDGKFNFSEGHEGFELNLGTSKMTYDDSKKILKPIYQEIGYSPDNLSFLASGEFNVKGDFKDSLTVKGPASLSYIDLYGELIDTVDFDFALEEDTVALSNVILHKGEGSLYGSFLYNMNTEFLEYDAKWNNIKPHDFKMYRQLNLGLQTSATLDIYGSGRVHDFTSRTKLTTNNSTVLGQDYEESQITVYGQSGVYEIQGNLFKDALDLSGELNFSKTNMKRSKLDLKVDIQDIREFFGLLSSHNIQDQGLKGKIAGQISSSFEVHKLDQLNLLVNLKQFDFQYRGLNLRPQNKLSLRVEKGEVINSDLELRSSTKYIIPDLKGTFKDNLSLDIKYDLPVYLLELASPEVQISDGEMSGFFSLGGTLENFETYAELGMKNVGARTRWLPGGFTMGSLKASLDNERLDLNSFKANYGKGLVEADGQVLLGFPFPTVNIKGRVSDAFIPLMNRSGIVTSANYSLTGESLPYLLKGKVSILFAEILEDIDEFRKQQASTSSYERFLPKAEGHVRNLIELDLDVDVQRPIQVRNSLLELNVDGKARVKGPLVLPRPTGRFEIVPSSSKFKFKGHEFNLTKGTITLGEEFNREGALLDFSGFSQINEYRVRLDVSGRTKNVDVTLSSEPGLSQEDLFSLLTLGVTSEVSSELDENERQSVATVGLGALLADQLKLNEGLDSSFGLRLSVLPEYAEESGALLQGKSAVSDSGTNRFRSSTKVRVQKKINDRVDLSVSSTVGGSLDQRQEMKMNYKISKDWSLEGVYELKSTEDEGVESSDSIGADLKYRWAF